MTEDGRQRLGRHGHLPEREITTGIGPVAVRIGALNRRLLEAILTRYEALNRPCRYKICTHSLFLVFRSAVWASRDLGAKDT
jgi:hypothetical protein